MRRKLGLAALLCGLLIGCTKVTPVHTSFVIEGMHCNGCSTAISEALLAHEGVISATADHERGTADAIHLVRRVSAESLVQSIEELGYTVTAIHSEPQS